MKEKVAADWVIGRGGDNAGRRRARGGVGVVGGERVHERVDELHGAGSEDDALAVGDGVADGPVQAPDLPLELHGLELAVGGAVAHAVPPGDHHGAGGRVPPPVRLQEQRVPAAPPIIGRHDRRQQGQE